MPEDAPAHAPGEAKEPAPQTGHGALNDEGQESLLNEQRAAVRNMERILDINLELTVKIGEIRMTLRDVLELHSGSILEIEKNADAPLDLQIGPKVLAKGEVVTIGENLGLRIIKK